MADIENLNFEVILQDKNFRKRVEEDIKIAQDLNVKLSDALNFNKKVSIDPLKRVTTEVKNMTKEMDKFNKSASKDVKKSVTQIGRMNTTLTTSGNLMRTLGQLTGVTFSVIGLRRFLSTLIDVTGQFEVQKMALRNMLQDIDAADKIFQDLYNFSSQSTYRFSELAKYAKQLAAFNIDQDNLLETTKMLGDVASGVGVSMDRLILAYGHVKSSGFLRGIQLRSFSQNGVPILEELSKMFTEIEGKAVSLGDVFDKMMKREIGFDMVEEAFRRMTSEGGKFYQMQEVLAKTLAGQINILKGKWENLMYAMGQSQEGVLKGVVSSLTNIVSNTENFGLALKEAIAILGAYRVAMIASVAATEGLAAAINVSLVGRAFKGIWAFVSKNPWALLAAGVTLLIFEVVKANKELSDTQKIAKALSDTTNDFNKAQGDEIRELDLLVGRLKSAKEGTEEYRLAKLALEKRFDPYIQQLRNEGVAVNDLSVLYDGLAKKITEANKQRFLEQAQSSISEAYTKATDNIEKDTVALINKMAGGIGRVLTGDEEGAIRHYIATGEHNSIFKTLETELNKNRTYTSNSPFATGYRAAMDDGTYMDSLRDLMNRQALADTTYTDAMVEAAKKFDSAQSLVSGNAEETQQQLIKVESIVAGIKNLDSEIDKIRTKAKSEGINEEEKSRLDALVEDREEQAKLYKSIMGKDYDKSVKAAQTEQDKATKDRISNLKAEAAVLEKYLDAREKLEPFFGGDTDNQLAKIFGDSRDYSALDADIATLCDRLRELGTEGAQAAEQIETRLGIDKVSAIVKAQTAMKKYDDALRKYLGEDFSFSGSSLEYKASRILADYNTKVENATIEYEKIYNQARALDQETRTLGEQFSAQLAQLEAERNEKFIGLAKSIYGQQTGGLNLTEWAHKSGREIKEIISAIGNISIPKNIADKLDEKTLKALQDALETLASDDIEKAFRELDENRLRNLRKAASSVSSIAGALKEYAEANGNQALADMAQGLGFIADTASGIIERVAQGDWPGAILSFVGSIAKEIMGAAMATAQLNAALAEATEQSRRIGLSNALKLGTNGIFGENGMAKVRNAVSVIKELRGTMSNGNGVWLRGKDSWLSPKWETQIGNLAAGVGGELYDAYGNLNAETLQTILNTYKSLDTESRAWIEHAIHDSEAYAEAMEQLEGVVSSVFGQIASSASDAIVEKWKERGDAALDYADILDDVATRYAKMMIESAILDKVLTPDKASAIVDMFARGDTEGAMERIAGDMQTIRDMEPVWEQILQAFDPYFNRSSSGTDSIKDGINKELVEGNSSLIASYMNAMRADLSVLRQLQTAGWADIRFVREMMPTLADHAARIEANTYDNAVAANAILGKLQSIITTSTNGGSAVRTTK